MRPRWHFWHSSSVGMWYVPVPHGMSPPSERVASVSSELHAYVASTQNVALTFCHMRVSTRLPSLLNSFQTFVPTGKIHSSAVELSIFMPGGRLIHRCFDAPSDHSG